MYVHVYVYAGVRNEEHDGATVFVSALIHSALCCVPFNTFESYLMNVLPYLSVSVIAYCHLEITLHGVEEKAP